jgi:hypothetical protein
MSLSPELKLDWCSHDAADFAVKRWHYSRILPTGKLIKIGVWEDKSFIGCVIFSRGASPYLLEKYAITAYEGCELTRVALGKHKTQVSRIVAIAIRFLRKRCPGLRLIVSFADPMEGHRGGIYQAGNWIYTGLSSGTVEYLVGGRWRHVRGVYHQTTDSTPVRNRCGKHRYVMPLDEAMRDTLSKQAKPFPKCVGSAASGTSVFQTERGGANPTSTLASSS